MNGPQLYIASSSSRRHELLLQLGIQAEIIPQDVPEELNKYEPPEDYVKRLALQKAYAGINNLGNKSIRPVLGADTAVVVDNEVLGKPVDKLDAMTMLQKLSGRQHQVLSAVAMVGRDDLGQDRNEVKLSKSIVKFRSITEKECEAYWETGEPVDKAGGYAIQGLAALFIERIEGSYSGVMGLPLFETGELLQQFGIEIF